MQTTAKGFNNQGGQMNVTKMPLDKITEAPYNPRKMDKKVFKKLVENIRKNKVYSPLIVNERTSHVVGGNQRLRALRERVNEFEFFCSGIPVTNVHSPRLKIREEAAA